MFRRVCAFIPDMFRVCTVCFGVFRLYVFLIVLDDAYLSETLRDIIIIKLSH